MYQAQYPSIHAQQSGRTVRWPVPGVVSPSSQVMLWLSIKQREWLLIDQFSLMWVQLNLLLDSPIQRWHELGPLTISPSNPCLPSTGSGKYLNRVSSQNRTRWKSVKTLQRSEKCLLRLLLMLIRETMALSRLKKKKGKVRYRQILLQRVPQPTHPLTYW